MSNRSGIRPLPRDGVVTAPPPPPPPLLALGIAVPEGRVPAWINQCIRGLMATGLARIVGTIQVEEAGEDSGIPRLYALADRLLFGCPTALRAEEPAFAAGGTPSLPTLDAIVWLGPGAPPADLRAAVPVWVPTLFGRPVGQAAPAAYAAMARRCPTATLELQVNLPGHRPRTALTATVRLDDISLARSLERILWQAAELPARHLRRVGAQRRPAAASAMIDDPPAPSHSTAGGIARAVGRFAARQARLRLLGGTDVWSVAMTPRIGALLAGGAGLQARDFVAIEAPAGSYYADPIPLVRDGVTHLFLEEYVGALGRGILIHRPVDGAGRVGPATRILERDFHLSYPFVFTWEGRLLMVPEGAASGRVELFECREFPHRWAPVATLLDGVRAYDATLREIDGRWWMFCSLDTGRAGPNQELHLFHAPAPTGPWHPHPLNPVTADIRAARPAGPLFRRSGAWIRPAQDCSRGYGDAVQLCRIEELSTTCYREVAVDRIAPVWSRHHAGLHTLSLTDSHAFIDLRRFARTGT